ncbi:hypothetical protein ANCCAN_18832 [Ancylostoma caninum]|uniref:Uncharacterized protein n=1 Tax=Ancylostoma caninum TaxID=29170 RepID=A0A368FSW8_ANCCA|nr:hypothetical protein ANCCAN_18832 [Ancylostoma caninum]
MTLDHGLTREWKQFARGAFRDEMLGRLPSEFTPIFNNIINTRFEERPRYQFIQRMIYCSATRQGIKLDVPYDWQVEPELLDLVKRYTAYNEGFQQKIRTDEADTAVELDKITEDETIAASVL